MLKEAFDWIKVHGKPNELVVGESRFSDRVIHKIVNDVPRVTPLKVNTLAGVVDYLTADMDKTIKPFVHIESPNLVKVVSPFFGETRTREVYLEAQSVQSKLNLDNYIPTEEMIIHLATCFVENADREALIQALSSLVWTTSVKKSDDGLSQQVEIKTGVVSTAQVEIRPIRKLLPIRTFSEITPSEEMFLLRIKKHSEGEFHAMLKSADGKRWENDARQKIAKFVWAALPQMKVIF